VLGLSTAGIDFDYIHRMLELEAPFDILTIHPYRRILDLAPQRSLDLGNQNLAWVFGSQGQPPRRPVTVLWNPHRDTEPEVPVGSGRVRLLNTVGEVKWLEAVDGRVRTPLRRGATVYLIKEQP
jgi:hypothetical protein